MGFFRRIDCWGARLAAAVLVLSGCISQNTTAPGPDAGAEAGPDCASFLDEQPLGTVIFTVKNTRINPVYITNDFCLSRFHVIEASFPNAVGYDQPVGWNHSCGAFSGSSGCEIVTSDEIAAGASQGLPWNGLLYQDVEPPPECYALVRGSPQCARGRTPKSGPMQVELTFYEGPGSYPSKATQGFNYPTDTKVEIEIQ